MALFNYDGYGYGYGQPTVINNPPMYYGGNGGGNGFFGNGSDGWLGVLFLIALLNGGWGGFGGNGGNAGWTTNMVQDGFNQAAVTSQLSGLQTSVTTGFSNQEVANCNRALDQMAASYNTQIANMQQNFANIQAIDGRLDAIAAAQANCCCENRAAIQDVKYAIANDGALTRNAIQNANQNLLDKLCQLELDGYKQQLEQARRDNVDLQNRLNMAAMQASQLQQTQDIENFVRPPINPAYTVPNPYACYSNSNCGCNGNVIGACA